MKFFLEVQTDIGEGANAYALARLHRSNRAYRSDLELRHSAKW
jgi:hypothetical protein